MSYGEVAVLAGHPGAARAVGTACRLTPFSIIVPVHRVVRSDGTPGTTARIPSASGSCSTSSPADATDRRRGPRE